VRLLVNVITKRNHPMRFHSWAGDYDKLEYKHGFIQWLLVDVPLLPCSMLSHLAQIPYSRVWDEL
jgi:hypothetical protein